MLFYLEGRGGQFLYHFYAYNLSVLYFLSKGLNPEGKDSLKLDRVTVRKLPEKIEYPIRIHMESVIDWQKEIFDVLKDRVTFVDNIPSDEKVISCYGDTLKHSHLGDHVSESLPYLRTLLLERIAPKQTKKRRLFISRNDGNSHETMRRIIINEKDFFVELEKYGFEYIKLRECSITEKINMFYNAELVVSSHGSGLIHMIFANKCRLVEIVNKGTFGFRTDYFDNIAKIIGYKYTRYSDIVEDKEGNFEININNFINHVKDYLLE